MSITVLILLTLFFANSNANDCPEGRKEKQANEKKKKKSTKQILHGWCENFTSLIELSSALFDNSSCPGYFESLFDGISIIITINIKANNYKGPLNDRFDYQRFIQTMFSKVKREFLLNFYGFGGIDLNFTTNYSYSANVNPLYLTFTSAKFDFYSNGTLVEMSSDGGTSCDDKELIKIIDKAKYGIFGQLSLLSINFELKSHNSYFKKWCPLIFKNAHIGELQIVAKPIRFYTGNSSYNISIQSVSFNTLVVGNFDKEILPPQVFSGIKALIITGSLKRIQTDVFKEMKNLLHTYLDIFNLKGFIHGNGIEWISYFNYYAPRFNTSRFELTCDSACLKLLSSSVSWITLGMFSFNSNASNKTFPYFPNMRPYAYPDKDFCIFSNYPHDRSVLIMLNYVLHDCTCTLVWIFKNAAILRAFNELDVTYQLEPAQNPCSSLINDFVKFKQVFNACGFPDRYQKCQLNMLSLNQSLASYTDSYFQFYDAQYVFIEIRDILKNYFDYWVLVVGFLANLITVIVIINAYSKAIAYSNNKDNQLGSIKENFFTYMLINSIINSIYCLIMFFNEVLPCVPNPTGEQFIEHNCVITDICITTTASVLKLTANVTYLQMSLNRYLLVGKDHSERLKKIGKANIVTVLIVAITTSCLLSYVYVEQDNFLNKLTEDSTQDVYNDYFSQFLYSYTQFNNFTYYSLVSKFEKKLPLIIPLVIIYDIVGYFLFVILNLILDVMTVIKLKETLAHKASIGVQSKQKKEEQERAERRSIIMVILNSLVNVLLRIPELLSIIFFFIINSQAFLLRECSHLSECSVMTQISNSFFNVTMIFNIFFYYFFNKTFKFAFHLIFTLNSKKSQSKK
jgi:hypothetical protein